MHPNLLSGNQSDRQNPRGNPGSSSPPDTHATGITSTWFTRHSLSSPQWGASLSGTDCPLGSALPQRHVADLGEPGVALLTGVGLGHLGAW